MRRLPHVAGAAMGLAGLLAWVAAPDVTVREAAPIAVSADRPERPHVPSRPASVASSSVASSSVASGVAFPGEHGVVALPVQALGWAETSAPAPTPSPGLDWDTMEGEAVDPDWFDPAG